MSALPLVLVVAALIEDDRGRVLLSRRKPGGPLGLCWEFPGGKVEIGESPEQALIREMKEEVGLTVSDLSPWQFVSHPYETFHLLMVLFRCGHFVGEVQPLDVHDVRWFHVSQLSTLSFPPADRPLLDKLLDNQKQP
ncbi:MAG: (deoxy)nucleoside triphosphate pyrophosphohydrolase [Magnetococcales bacterium]|nr:(deoxy)nucleoside triphosphate pyrophosphohydrolase [Magnetococcales bacterium]